MRTPRTPEYPATGLKGEQGTWALASRMNRQRTEKQHHSWIIRSRSRKACLTWTTAVAGHVLMWKVTYMFFPREWMAKRVAVTLAANNSGYSKLKCSCA